MNDICRLPLIDTQPPQLLATIVIYIVLQSTMLEITEQGKRWFKVRLLLCLFQEDFCMLLLY